MAFSPIRELIGEPRLPVPIHYEAPLPGDVADSEDIRRLLDLTGAFGGDPAFANQIFAGVGLPLLLQEAAVIQAAWPQASARQAGLSSAVVKAAKARYPTATEPTTGPKPEGEMVPVRLVSYFQAIHRCLTDPRKALLEAETGILTLLSPQESHQFHWCD